jgi:hypothetical protein
MLFLEHRADPTDVRRTAYRQLGRDIQQAASWDAVDVKRGGSHAAAWSAANSLLSRAGRVLESLHEQDETSARKIAREWSVSNFERHPMLQLYTSYLHQSAQSPTRLEKRIKRVLKDFLARGGKPETVRAIVASLQAA